MLAVGDTDFGIRGCLTESLCKKCWSICLAVCLFVCLFVCFQCCHLNERLHLCVIVHGNCGAKVQHQRSMHSCVLVNRSSLRCQLYVMTVRTGGVRSALPTCTKHTDNA